MGVRDQERGVTVMGEHEMSWMATGSCFLLLFDEYVCMMPYTYNTSAHVFESQMKLVCHKEYVTVHTFF